MELNEFLEKFLPDYESKKIIVMFDLAYKFPLNDHQRAFLILSMFTKYFTEIIQNFADKLCEKQREICAESFIEAPLMLLEEYCYNGILNAKQPKIDELI